MINFSKFKITVAVIFSVSVQVVFSQLSITNQTSYHKASFGSIYGSQEGGTIDNGGVITFFVLNLGNAPDTLLEVKISKSGVYDTTHFMITWPKEISAGGKSAVCIKGLSTPFAEGDTVLLEVLSTTGFSAQQTFINKTPGLRLANIIPSHDLTALWIYLRNDQTTSVEFSGLELNDQTFQNGNPALTMIGGNSIIEPNQVGIIKLQLGSGQLSALLPLNLNVRFHDGVTEKNVSTFQRLVPAEYPIGTWHSPLANSDQENGRKIIRKLAATSIFGPNDVSNMSDNLPEYYMKVVREADFSNNNAFDPNQAAQYVQQHSANPIFHYWNVDDEPDLNNKPIKEEIIKNLVYWNSDSNTPSYVNLASQKNYQRYGFFTDVVSMDHYSDDGPPNVIPFPYWYTVEGSVREAIEYTAQLKKNTEPKRMNTWCQLISTAFTNQAEPHVINFQFWSHVAEGAKGIHFFTAKPNHPNEYPQLWKESEKLVYQLNGIKNICLYSEPFQGVTVNSGNVIAKSLVGPDAMTIVLLNNTIDYTSVNVINHAWTSTITSTPFDIQFTIPDWISLEQFYETTANGKIEISSITNISGRTYRITGTIDARTRVFVIGKNDNEVPNTITEINVSDLQSPSDFTLSWNEPLDNFGVKGYYIKADNSIIDTVMAPIWESAEFMNGCLVNSFSVIPFDEQLNLGLPTSVTLDLSSFGSGTPTIYQEPASQSVNAGTWANFSVADSAASQSTFVWQVNTGNGPWVNLQNDANYSGVFTSTLSVYGLPTFNNYSYRCIVSAGCTQNADTSSAAVLTVVGQLSINELSDSEISLFPNPANNVMTISSNGEALGNVIVFNQWGVKVQEFTTKSTTYKLNISNFENGIYLVQFPERGRALKFLKSL